MTQKEALWQSVARATYAEEACIVKQAASIAALAIVALIASSAGAAPTDADFQVDIGVATTLTSGVQAIPNGGTATVKSRSFFVGVRVRLIPAQSASATVRLELSDGLSWGADKPAATPNCTGTTTTAECRTMPNMRPDPAGEFEEHFGWGAVASQFGRYTVRAQISGASTPDPVLSNNAASVTVVVTEPTSTLFVGAAKITPTKPKAGSLVSATVEIISAGSPLRPTALRCSGSLGGAPLVGTPRAAKGRATCLYHPPRSAKGKTLRGVVSFAVASKTFAKRFGIRLS